LPCNISRVGSLVPKSVWRTCRRIKRHLLVQILSTHSKEFIGTATLKRQQHCEGDRKHGEGGSSICGDNLNVSVVSVPISAPASFLDSVWAHHSIPTPGSAMPQHEGNLGSILGSRAIVWWGFVVTPRKSPDPGNSCSSAGDLV
jgi:hypothetical protein